MEFQTLRAARLLATLLVLGAAGMPHAQSGPSEEDLKRANNPLADVKAFNLQNYFVPKLAGLDGATANTFWLRGVVPFGRVLVRASLPLPTVPTGPASTSGLGDFNMFAAYLAKQSPSANIGFGPLLAVPTASKDELGAGKWQGGAAAVAFMMPSVQIQYGALVTWQASFAGKEERADTSVLVTQPFLMLQLGGGNYLRGAPIAAFNLRNGDYAVPFGLGLGKVVKVETIVFNIFLEPQFTILHQGVGQPLVQIFTGMNMQF